MVDIALSGDNINIAVENSQKKTRRVRKRLDEDLRVITKKGMAGARRLCTPPATASAFSKGSSQQLRQAE